MLDTIKKILTLLALLCFQYDLCAEEEKIVNLYNWADYIGPTTIADFEKEYGIKVNYDIYDTTDIVDAKLMAGRTGYDVIIHSAAFSARLIQAGIYQQLDKNKLDNWKHMDPDILQMMTDFALTAWIFPVDISIATAPKHLPLSTIRLVTKPFPLRPNGAL